MLALVGVGAVAAHPARAAVVFELVVPLTSEADTLALIAARGGRISGGAFGPQGWTTLSRDDFIEINLPAGLDTSTGALESTLANFEMTPAFSTDYWGFELVALDPFGAQQDHLPPAGRAHLATGYRGDCSDCGSHVFTAITYWNLFDPSCDDWRNCTTEGGSGGGFIGAETVVTWRLEWQGTTVWSTFIGDWTTTRTIGLAATAPNGVLREDQLILTINNCGGAGQIACGSWDEPWNRGGPLGVTYASVVLRIEGAADVDGGSPADGAPLDGGGAGDAGTPDGGSAVVDARVEWDAREGGVGRDAAAAATDAPGTPTPDAAGAGVSSAHHEIFGSGCSFSGASLPGSLAGLVLMLAMGVTRWRLRVGEVARDAARGRLIGAARAHGAPPSRAAGQPQVDSARHRG